MDIPRDRDIIGNVIAAVSDDTPRHLLKQCQCTLVSSSSLLPTSRKQLFSKISLKGDQTCQGIHQFLVQNPVTGSDEGLNDIQPLVRTIALTDDTGSRRRKISLRFKNPKWMNGASLLAILRLLFPCLCLEHFLITLGQDGRLSQNFNPWNWNTSFSGASELNDALSNILT